MNDVPRSKQFDDVYFSAEDGLAETRHVFVQGNDLPSAWQGREHYVIAETGFGTGLNFLTAWKLFEETAKAGQTLDFISFEKYPLSAEEIRGGLMRWQDELGGYLDRMLAQYPIRAAGFHRMVFGNVILTLVFDDVNEALPQLSAKVDSWFLDGFTPAKNPQMWTETVFKEMGRLSQPGASFATFTAAGDVRRGLQAAGFTVEKKPGFGRKRDMIAGRFEGERKNTEQVKPKRVAVIGGGLAGTSCAYVLKQYGFEPVLYEKSDDLAAGASGNPVGIYNPRFTAFRGAESDFYAAAFAQAVRVFESAKSIGHVPCGSLHLINSIEKEKRLTRTQKNWQWHEDHMRLLDASEASEIAGIEIDQEALYLPDAGAVSPEKLCRFYADGIEVHLNSEIDDLDKIEADAVVLSCGAAVKGFAALADLPVHTVRGQITFAVESEISRGLKTNLCFGGYMSPSIDGRHAVGASFQKWLTDTDVIEEDHVDNLSRLYENVPALAGELKAAGGRAALRTSSKDRFPVIGKVEDGVYVSTAHGSHGILSSLAGAHLIADQIRNGPLSLSARSIEALDPARFEKRAERKGQA